MKVTKSFTSKISKITIDADIAMATYKLTGLGAGAASGQSVRYEQVVGVYLPLAGGTMAGDIALGANKLKTTNHILKEQDVQTLALKNADDNAYQNLLVNTYLFYTALVANADGLSIYPYNSDNYTLLFKARDSGVGLAEVARLVGAADPYFQATLPMVLKPVATASLPSTPVEGMIGYDSTLDKITYRDAGSWQTLEPVSIVRKTADETVHDSTTWQNDDALLKSLAASEVWVIELLLLYTSGTTPDIKIQCTVPSGAVVYLSSVYPDTSLAAAIIYGASTAISMGGNAANVMSAKVTFIVINSTNAGNFTIQWAQNTQDDSDTIVKTNSILICRKIS